MMRSMRAWVMPGLLTALLIAILLTAAGCGRNNEAAKPRADAAPLVATPMATKPSPAPVADQPATADTAPAPTLTPMDKDNTVTTSAGLQYTETTPGTGPKPNAGDIVFVHYTGSLQDGTVFDSSLNRGEPLRFVLGAGQVIPGWDTGIAMMNKGGQALLVIPPELAYGASGAGNVIPPNATLVFDLELVDVQPGAPAAPTAVDDTDYVVAENGLKTYDFVIGDGPAPKPGQEIVVHYTGWVLDGPKFDSSLDRGEPFSFNLGMGQVIGGWDQGLPRHECGRQTSACDPAGACLRRKRRGQPHPAQRYARLRSGSAGSAVTAVRHGLRRQSALRRHMGE